MAWDWSKSGRYDTFEFELIPVSSVDKKPSGKLSGVTGGKLTMNYDSTEKVSGTLSVVKTNMVNNSYVRIWYCPKLGTQEKRIELATCFATTENGHYEDGVYSGTVMLHGVLWRFLDDELAKAFTIKKGSSALAAFKNVFKMLGGQYKIVGVKDRKPGSNVVFTRGQCPMDILQWVAKYLGAELTCDSHGRIVLQKYVPPGKKPVKYTAPSGASSVTLPGVDIRNTAAGTTNRVSVGFTWTEQKQQDGHIVNIDKSLVGVANVAAKSVISRQKAGRYITRCYDLEALTPRTQARINSIAKTYLKQASGTTVSYTFRTVSYLPIKIGDVVTLKYDSKLKATGLARVIEYDLSAGLPMKIEVRER